MMDGGPAASLAELEKQIASRLTVRDGTVAEATRLRRRLGELRAEARAISGNIRADRELLRSQIDSLRSLRETRRQTLEHLAEVREETRRVREGFRQFSVSLRRSEGAAAQETLRRLEWKLQTARLTREEEKELVGKVRELERKLLLWRKAYGERERLNRLSETLGTLRARLDELDAIRTEAEPRLRELKDRLTALHARRQQVFEEAADIQADVNELSSRIASSDEELARLRAQRRDLLSSQRAAETEKRLARQRQTLNDAYDLARAKLRDGQKLTFDELKVLLAKDEPELLK